MEAIAARLGHDVDHAARMQSVLGGQRPIEQAQIADEAGFQYGTQRGNPVRKLDAVDAELDVRVFVAHMKIGVADRRIVRHAGNLQQHLVHRRVFSLRQGLQSRLIDQVGGGSEFGQQMTVAQLIQILVLPPEGLVDPVPTDHDRAQLGVRGCALGSAGICGRRLRARRNYGAHLDHGTQGKS